MGRQPIISEWLNIDNDDNKVIATISYIKDTAEKIAEILRPPKYYVGHKTSTMHSIRDVLTKVKDPSPTYSRTGAVEKTLCAECPASFAGETGRTLECRIEYASAAQRTKI